MTKMFTACAIAGILLLAAAPRAHGQATSTASTAPKIHSVLLLSIDGMHALDLANCMKGMNGINNASPYCPNLAALAATGVNYVQASSTKPSDSFPGMSAQLTGGTSRSTGFYYDVSYNRSLSPPAKTTPYGIPGGQGLCPGTLGTPVGFDEGIDYDLSRLDGGGGINPAYLPRDPKKNCAPVWPHSYLKVNTIFEVVKAAGLHTAWSDKHPSYEWTNGPSGKGVEDFYGPEINSVPVNLPNMPSLGLSCSPLPDQSAVTTDDDYTTSFLNIQCYDALKVQAVINQIFGKTHDGSNGAPLPAVFGMNFQAVSVGQKLVEHHTTTGGYRDTLGTPSASLASEIQFVDAAIGQMVAALKQQGQLDTTLIIISAKHGQSPMDPNRVRRIPGDNAADMSPATILGGNYDPQANPASNVAQSIEDDVSLIWLRDQSQTGNSVRTLSMSPNAALAGTGEIFSGPAVSLMFADPTVDDRAPDIIVTPDIGVVYTGGTKKVSEHGGFAHDDTHVMLLVSNPDLSPATVAGTVETRQIAPTILTALGLNPQSLQAVVLENTQKLPGLPF